LLLILMMIFSIDDIDLEIIDDMIIVIDIVDDCCWFKYDIVLWPLMKYSCDIGIGEVVLMMYWLIRYRDVTLLMMMMTVVLVDDVTDIVLNIVGDVDILIMMIDSMMTLLCRYCIRYSLTDTIVLTGRDWFCWHLLMMLYDWLLLWCVMTYRRLMVMVIHYHWLPIDVIVMTFIGDILIGWWLLTCSILWPVDIDDDWCYWYCDDDTDTIEVLLLMMILVIVSIDDDGYC